jgi:hypothetical protein
MAQNVPQINMVALGTKLDSEYHAAHADFAATGLKIAHDLAGERTEVE